MDTGLLILRVVVGLLFVGHGTQKLFGWFGGYGIAGTGGFLESIGYRPGRFWAFVAGAVEALAGLLLVAGLFLPLAGAMLVGQMLNAAWTTRRDKGLWVAAGGYEYELVLAAAAAALAFTGPGEWSLDDAFDLDVASDGWGVAAVAVGLVVGVVTLAVRRVPPATVDLDAAPAAEGQAEASTMAATETTSGD